MGKPLTYCVTLIRVGDTAWDEEHRLIGQTDLPLTENAASLVQSAVVQDTSRFRNIAMLLVSEEEAAQATMAMLPVGNETKKKTIPELSNVGLGLWEGVLESDLQERNPSTYSQWREHPERITPPEGESLADARDRLVEALRKPVGKLKGENPEIVLVLRPLAWAVIRCWLQGQKLCNIWDELQSPITVESFELKKSRFDEHKQHTRASA